MKITEAKKRLYAELRHNEYVVGAGITTKNGVDVIMIMTTRKGVKIPKMYEGFKVVVEVTGPITFQKEK